MAIEEVFVSGSDALVDICVSAYLYAGRFVRASTSFRGEERFDDVALVSTEHVHDCVSVAVVSFDVLTAARLFVLFRFRDERLLVCSWPGTSLNYCDSTRRWVQPA